MDKENIKLLNEVFQSKDWLKLTKDIDEQTIEAFHLGKIEIPTLKGLITLDVRISEDFPLGKIEFLCTSHVGLNHESPNGQLCLHASPSKNLIDRIELELEKLHIWYDKYFIRNEEDEHFEYYQFNKYKNIQMLFEEDEFKESLKKSFGKFSYGKLNEYSLGEKTYRCFIAADNGGRINRWSEHYQKMSKDYTGIWLSLSKPPVIQGRQTIQNWSDLLRLISADQAKFLYDEYKSIKGNSFYKNGFLIMLGYYIKGDNGKEIHWDMVFVRFDDFPYTSKKIAAGVYEPLDLGMTIAWCKTTNTSYRRLFGRGKLSDNLTNGKILIIGIGAIGSSLVMSLVRGGCKDIHITDFDDIDPGNICRGHFSFTESFKPKIFELYNSAITTSPFIKINHSPGIRAILKTNKNYDLLKKALMQFDYIFDCSTDKYLSMMLDDMNLRGQIINLSISNKAEKFVVITGKGNIHTTKSNFYDSISSGKPEPFFVATGCWQPTFQASYSDVNIGLTYALNEINQKLESKDEIRSFYIEKGMDEKKSLTYEISYNV